MVSREMEIATLKDAVVILKRVAKVERDQEVQEAVNVIEVVIGDLGDRLAKVNRLLQHYPL